MWQIAQGVKQIEGDQLREYCILGTKYFPNVCGFAKSVYVYVYVYVYRVHVHVQNLYTL